VRRWLLIGVTALIAAMVVIVMSRASTHSAMPRSVQRTTRSPVDARAPDGVRIRVEVLNATRTRGLARRASMHLRDRGFDVVAMGTSARSRDSTLVLDRSNHPDWARLVARAMGGARVESRPDSSRYLDVTVLIGAAWRAPSEPFYP
jgi:LytR cell envelope-related transcriptional attenuator